MGGKSLHISQVCSIPTLHLHRPSSISTLRVEDLLILQRSSQKSLAMWNNHNVWCPPDDLVRDSENFNLKRM